MRPASAPLPTLSLVLRPQHLTPIQGYATPPHAHTGMVLLSQHSTARAPASSTPFLESGDLDRMDALCSLHSLPTQRNLFACHKNILKGCAAENKAFMMCKAENEDPRACAELGCAALCRHERSPSARCLEHLGAPWPVH
eukprot:COSAG06_NODE_1033_length_11001_cov_5.119795_6_plen_140_part_00